MNKWHKKIIKIRFRLLAFGIAMSILPLLLLGYLQIKAGTQNLQDTVQKHNVLVAQRTAVEVGRLVENISDILQAAAKLQGEKLLAGNWDDNRIELNAILKISPYFEEISLISGNGTEIHRASRIQVFTPQDLRPTVAVNLAQLASNETSLGPVYLGSDGCPYVNMAVALRDRYTNSLQAPYVRIVVIET